MRTGLKLGIAAAGLTALPAGCATPPPMAGDPIGGTLHYVRSNIAGGEEEQVHVQRAARDRIEVYKMRQRCTGAALVTARIDPASGEASELIAGRLAPEATMREIGRMRLAPDGRRIIMELALDGRQLREAVTVDARPWHLYDFDLATLTVATQAMRHPRPFSFGLALVWPEDGAPPLRWLGRAEARPAGRERHLGHDSWRYTLSGPAFGTAGGGTMWIDRRTRLPVDVVLGRPNHPGYRDLRLRLAGVARDGEAGWRRRLRDHFAGCAASG